jgi:hypothetical protein
MAMRFVRCSTLLVGWLLASVAMATGLPQVEVYKSATCGCCGRWVEHMREAGFEVATHDIADVPAQRARLGMPSGLAACHTAVVSGYLVEGHVPAADVKLLLAQKPKAVGLAVPGMPKGSPGMEAATPSAYDVLLVGRDGIVRTFASH